MPLKSVASLAFAVLLWLVIVYATWTALGFPRDAGLMPLVIGVPGCVAATIKLGLTVRDLIRERLREQAAGESSSAHASGHAGTDATASNGDDAEQPKGQAVGGEPQAGYEASHGSADDAQDFVENDDADEFPGWLPFVSVAAFLASFILLGLVATVAVLGLIYLRWTRASWVTSVALAGGTAIFIVAISSILSLRLYEGIFFT